MNNAKFEPVIGETNEISYIKKYCNLFYNEVSNFVNSDILERQIEQDFQQQFPNVRHVDPFRPARLTSIKSQVQEKHYALEYLKNKDNKFLKKENSLKILK